MSFGNGFYSTIFNQNQITQSLTQPRQNPALAAAIARIKKDLSEHPIVINKESIVYEMDPLVKEEYVSDLTYIGVPTYKIETDYNFYTDHYEDIVKEEDRILEPALPNLYIFGDDKNEDTPAYKKIITVNDKVEIKAKESENTIDYFNQYAFEYRKTIENPNEEISEFNKLALTQKTVYLAKNLLNRLSDINKNQYLMPYNNKISFETNEFSILMGILEESKFTDEFCSLLISTQRNFSSADFNLLTDVIKRTDDSITIEQELTEETLPAVVFENTEMMFRSIKEVVLKADFKFPFTLGSDVERKSKKQARRIASEYGYGQAVTTTTPEVKNNQKSTLEKAIRLKVFSKRYNEFINNIKLKSSQIFKNNLLYTEILMYELVKANKDDETGSRPIQSFFMPNLSDIEKIEFIDSQVKYGKEYNYILNSFNFALSVEINQKAIDNLTEEEWLKILQRVEQKYPSDQEYFKTVFTPPPILAIASQVESAAKSDIRQRKNRKKQDLFDKIKGIKRPEKDPKTSQTLDISYYTDHIFEVMLEMGYDLLIYKPTIFKRRLFSEIMAVSDNPPPPPEIQIHGMMGIDNKLFFVMNGSIAEFKAQPVIIQNSDLIVFSKNVLAQKLKNLQDTMMFDGDDRINHFQIFRLEHHPHEYVEFKDHFVTASTTINCADNNSLFSACDPLRTNHSTYLDNIHPNKKYYYMLRSVDVHGNVSNPSPIYEIEMINSDGTIFPLINVVELLKKENKSPFKQVRRFLQIYPNMKQSLINEKDSQYFDEDGNIKQTVDLVKDKVVLGLTEEKIWNKKYRLKIRSKTTGKLIEIDFKFTHKTVPEEPNCE